jgi:drug/metabolite transporter (DMT)-like permease
LFLKEHISASRLVGAFVIVGGLGVIGAESIGHIGADGVLGDLTFVLTGFMFASFGALLRYWRVSAVSAALVINVLSLLLLPIYLMTGGLARVAAMGVTENAIQALAQGVLAGPAALYLYAVSVQRLGVARASVIPACVPALTLLTGWLLLGEQPTMLQAAGLVTVLCGFYLAQRQR